MNVTQGIESQFGAMGGALYPDHVVFLEPSPLLVVAADTKTTV
jgi:rhamnose utilization protein RhaD (predicted bifunctional aldolase and dehydrogenase)